MICKKCGYNDKKPLGKALEDAKKGETVLINLNANGLKAFHCGHLELPLMENKLRIDINELESGIETRIKGQFSIPDDGSIQKKIDKILK